ncbi:MAG TPA: VOC family protein [Candidatus Elarobacter sp.]|nr:VOC family protein [Candidatus Elarobacter sp.]
MGNPVVHFEVVGKDLRALQTFYKDAFGWQIGPPVPGAGVNYALVDTHDESGINGGLASAEDAPSHVTFYVQVGDLDAALAKIAALGGSTAMPPDQVPGGPRIALFKDPEGHLIGLVQNAT